MLKNSVLLAAVSALALSACTLKNQDDLIPGDNASFNSKELAQNVGEVVASIDDMSGDGSGTFAMMRGHQKTIARLLPGAKSTYASMPIMKILLPEAQAAACSTVSYAACAPNGPNHSDRTKTFGGCTIGDATVTGSADLSYFGTGNNSCRMSNASDAVAWKPNATATNADGSFSITAPGSFGIVLTRENSTDFHLTNDGIRRVLTYSGMTLLDTTTTIENATRLQFTGASRSGRVLSSGTITITNNRNSKSCSYSPSAVTWGNASCRCPNSGTISGTCTDGATSVVTFGSTCGTVTINQGGTQTEVELDRCI